MSFLSKFTYHGCAAINRKIFYVINCKSDESETNNEWGKDDVLSFLSKRTLQKTYNIFAFSH